MFSRSGSAIQQWKNCRLNKRMELGLVVQDSTTSWSGQKREMSRRSHYIRGASNKQEISEATKELLKNARNPEDYRWQLGSGIQEPIEIDVASEERKTAKRFIYRHYGDRINDGEEVVKYYPHQGEEVPKEAPSPVLMVKRVKTLIGEPYFNKFFCEQIGLGKEEKLGKLTFLPNVPSVSLLLFKIKHLLEIKPVTFPNGIPDDFNPDKDGAKLFSDGRFVVHPSLAVDTENVYQNAEFLKIEGKHIESEARKHWQKPFNSPLGHSNYHQDTRWMDNDKADSLYVKTIKKKWS